MKAILIDPFAKSVSEYEWDGEIESLYEILDCAFIDAAVLDTESSSQHSIFVDDEGLRREGQQFWHSNYYPYELAGRGLLVAFNPFTGEELPPTLTVEEVRENTVFGVRPTWLRR